MKTLGPFEEWTMPNGDVVYYRDSDHSYWTEIQGKAGNYTAVRDSRLPSPSTIAKFADPSPDKLMDWAARKNLEGVMQLGTLDSVVDANQLARTLSEKKLTWRHLREKAGTTGTSIHEAFERGLRGTPVALRDVSPEEHGHLIALDRFFNDYHGMKALQTEQVVYSYKYGFAGRFDARVLDHEDGKTILLDLKTSKYIGRAYHAQLHGYDLAAEECGIGASDELYILQTRVEGTYSLWPCRSSRETFLHALALYRAGQECDRQTKQDFREMAA